MRKTRWILFILIALTFGLSTPGAAESPGWHLSVKRIWLTDDQGLWANLQYQAPQGQSLYWESLQIGDLYQQQGMGFGVTLLQNAQYQLSNINGVDHYRLLDTTNEFYRTGLVLELELPRGRLTLGGDLLLDDLIGIFGRYQINYALSVSQGKLEVGSGNLLGSQEGLACWVGIGF